ncbi:MAG TPA: DUF1285 domain-containing protein [Deltaproteobacteria bacterium]|nr:DUF1285 domain-containing protein [Deltaproteobacteria bacterium]
MNTQFRDVTEHCPIRIDKEGRWYYEEKEIINENVLLAFCNALEKDPEGNYRIVIESELCYVDVEDTPFVVSSIRGEKETGLYVLLNTSAVHELDPSTLSIGKDNVLYCTLPDGMKVRFTRAAYYLLALMMEEDDQGNITLTVGEKTYPVLKDPHFSQP